MSVTFSAPGPIAGFAFTCGHDNGLTERRFGTYADAVAFRQAELDAHGDTGHLTICGDEYCANCPMFIVAVESDPSPSMNVSEANARHLAGLLGYGEDSESPGGCATGEDFLGRILLAQAVNPADAGVPVTTTRASGGLTLIDCGRAPGYSEDRLAALRELADFAADRGRTIQWS